MDKAYCDYCRADYTRCNVYVPVFDDARTQLEKEDIGATMEDEAFWDLGFWDDCTWDEGQNDVWNITIKALENAVPADFGDIIKSLESV